MILGVAALVTIASATPYLVGNQGNYSSDGVSIIPNYNNDGSPDIYEAINKLAGTKFDGNDDASYLRVENDGIWTMVDTKAPVALIGLTAGYTNTLGVYYGSKQVNLLTATGFGFADQSGVYSNFTYLPNDITTSTPLGFYLNANQQNMYYSEAAKNTNDNGYDHMLTYNLSAAGFKTITVGNNGKNTTFTLDDAYLLCWEDLKISGGLYTNYGDGKGTTDGDYDDMMYIVAKVKPVPVPEPGMLSLAGLSLLSLIGLAASRRKR